MAIEKIEGAPKVEWTTSTLVQLGVSGLMVVLSIVFGWFALANWRFKANLVEGYQEYDRGHPAAAKKPLESALSWRKHHTGARELLAKILCDEGSLPEARRHYQELLAQGYDVPQVHVGLGVLSLKEVESLDKAKAIEAMVAEADAEFRKVGGMPEAEIGRGHGELVLARKLADPSHYTKAQAIFAKIQAAMEKDRKFRSEITRDGLVDYYTGLGKSLAAGDKFDETARASFSACYQYVPTWHLPMSNVLALEARRFVAFNEGNDVLMKMQTDINAVRNQARIIFGGLKGNDKNDMREQWLMFSLALGGAWGRAGNAKEMENIFRDLVSAGGFDARPEPYLMDAQARTELAVKDDPNLTAQDAAVTRMGSSYTELLAKLPADDANKERRARAYNNSAWTLAWRGGYTNNEGQYTQAVARLTEALRLFPDDYWYNRNMAILLKRFKVQKTSPAAYVDKCRAAAAKDKDLADDFDKLQKYIDSK